MNIEHEMMMPYLKERFASCAAFEAALQADKTIIIDWMAQLPPDKRQAMLLRVAEALQTGPCALIRTTGPQDEPILNGHYVIVQSLLDKLLKEGKRRAIQSRFLRRSRPLICGGQRPGPGQ
jgi:hypothetical protein